MLDLLPYAGGAGHCSPDRYVAEFERAAAGSYSKLAPQFVELANAIAASDVVAAARLNQYLLLSLLMRFDVDLADINLTPSVLSLYPRELKRICALCENPNLGYFRLENDPFLKDIAILTHRLIPVGAEFVVPDAGVPRSLMFRDGARQLFTVGWTCMAVCGGFSPFLELHAHPHSLTDFNAEGWQKTYRTLADLLRANPRLKGVFSSSWFLDPALKGVSPHLTYLREVPERGGAALVFSDIDSDGSSGALETSRTRRRMFVEGQYVPKIYARIWPRERLLSNVGSVAETGDNL